MFIRIVWNHSWSEKPGHGFKVLPDTDSFCTDDIDFGATDMALMTRGLFDS